MRMMSAFRQVRSVAVLSLADIVKVYGRKTVLNQVSLQIGKGEIVGLLGPNGAGKTTLLKVIAGLSIPTSGRMEILGTDVLRCRNGINGRIGFVPQDNNMEREFTVREGLLSYAKLFGVKNPEARVAVVVDAFHLGDWQGRKIDLLSGGMARRALIARAVLPQPEILLLDEPSVGLDPDMRQEIWQVVRQLKRDGKTIVMTTHYMEEAEALCDRVALLKDGRLLLMDTVAALKEKADGNSHKEESLETAFLRLVGRAEAV